MVGHLLEHIQNPVDFLKQLGDANGKVVKIYIKVPCLIGYVKTMLGLIFFMNMSILSGFQIIIKYLVKYMSQDEYSTVNICAL